MDEVERYLAQLEELYGGVKRARGPFLYMQRGVRLTDLYQDDGRAILGWRAGSSLSVMKRLIDCGATGSYHTAQSHRLARAVAALFLGGGTSPDAAAFNHTDIEVLAFAHKEDCLSCASAISGHSVQLWRPWCNELIPGAAADSHHSRQSEATIAGTGGGSLATAAAPTQSGGAAQLAGGATGSLSMARGCNPLERDGCIAFCPPLPWGGGVYLVAAQSDMVARCGDVQALGRAIVLPPQVEASCSRAVWDLIAALKTRCEQQWFIWDIYTMRYWLRRGPYMYPTVGRQAYSAFCEHCLKLGIVVNPRFDGASIVPYGAQRGVLAVLRKAPFEQ